MSDILTSEEVDVLLRAVSDESTTGEQPLRPNEDVVSNSEYAIMRAKAVIAGIEIRAKLLSDPYKLIEDDAKSLIGCKIQDMLMSKELDMLTKCTKDGKPVSADWVCQVNANAEEAIAHYKSFCTEETLRALSIDANE